MRTLISGMFLIAAALTLGACTQTRFGEIHDYQRNPGAGAPPSQPLPCSPNASRCAQR